MYLFCATSKLIFHPAALHEEASPLHTPAERKPRGRPRKSVYTVAEEIQWEEEASSSKMPRRQHATQIAKKVVVPSTSSVASPLSSMDDQSSEHETPATSLAVTPAESVMKNVSARRQSTTLSKVLPKPSVSRVKRKRLDNDDLEEADARLAQALQEEEYEAESMVVKSARPSRTFVDDSDELLSSAPEDDDLEDDQPLIKRVRTRKAVAARRRRPKASTSATKVSRGAQTLIEDSEDRDLSDESDESEFILEEEDSDGPADPDDAEEEGAESNHDTNIQLDTTSVIIQSAAARSRQMRRAAAAASRRRRGGRVFHVDDRSLRERRKLEKAHPEILTMWQTLMDIEPIVPAAAAQPVTITRRLKSFQLEGLDWMTRQEKSQWRGGLLGDEMGMGKTIQAVSLIMSDYPVKEPTLVVVPPVALMQWQSEIKEYTNGKLRVLVYHNTNPKVKNLQVKDLKEYDVIMISYSGLESIYRKESKGWKRDDGLVKENSKIHAIQYHRLILDEAHNIKSRSTSCAKACFALKADYKWCLSGTPVQNRIGEFFSLLRFLQIRPFACYFCKKCPCAELHWNQDESKKCTACNHTGFHHVSIFNQELLNPITQGEDPELRREGLNKLRLVTDRIMLRRMKRDHTASMELPPKEVIIHNEFFGEIERDFSSSIMSNTTRQFDTYVSRGVMLNNYANIFGLIMQMRQVANHPDLILKKHAAGGQNVLVCSICDETAEEPIRSRCRHEFCRKCAKDYVRSFEDETPDCPRCHIALAIDFDQPDIEQDEDNVKRSSIINRIKMEDWTSSTKIEMLVYDLYKLRSQKQTHKSIVFSQFTSMLQLVEWRLRRAGFNTVMLDGSMSPAQRQKSIEYFMNNTDVEVFLVSLKAGGVALNLTEASRVFIIDP